MTEAHHHRPTLKQQNKPFKSKHATKSSLKHAAKGRKLQKASQAAAAAAAHSRVDRRNHARQIQANKRQALASAARIFSGIDGAPRIVAVVPLSEDVNAKDAVCALAESLELSVDGCPEHGTWRMRVERFKTSLQFVTLQYRSFYAALDACKAADYVVFLLSPTVEVDDWGDTLLRALQAQGMPSVVSVIARNPALDTKSRSKVQGSLLSFMQYFVPSQAKVFDLHTPAEALNAVRALSVGNPSDVRWREGRTWILSESVEWKEDGTIAFTGVVRGAPLSAKRSLHVPDYGDVQISKVLSAPLTKPSVSGRNVGMDVEPTILAERHASDGESDIMVNDPDDLANEQTWPTEDEMRAAEKQPQLDGVDKLPAAKKGTTPKRIRRIPKGMSEYQAAWLVDDEDEEANEDDEDDMNREEGSEKMQDEEEKVPVVLADQHDIDLESQKDVVFQDFDPEEENKQLEKWRNRKREEKDDLAFPDEIDTPRDVSASVRFQRYRGLQSLRTSRWDPYENLPRDYARIFQFEDRRRTERTTRIQAHQESGTIQVGARVTVFVRGMPEEAKTLQWSSAPVTLFGLLRHEQSVTVLNFTVQRNTECRCSVRSKDPLVLCVGPRRLRVNPIYSQHAQGGGKGTNHVHKFERYLRHGSTSVATIYGPIFFGKQPCTLLKETPDAEAPQLVATGTFLNPDTTRIIAKRIILTGHPFKVHKKTATIRYMFFNPEDVMYFKPIALHTKYGRTGHIRESLGTHGYFKAHFDGPLSQMDTVCLSLYKRVFPRWSQLWTRTSGRLPSPDAMEV